VFIIEEYKLMKLIDNIYNRVKYGTMEKDEMEQVYNNLINFADADFEV
jgi:hypothetical protein